MNPITSESHCQLIAQDGTELTFNNWAAGQPALPVGSSCNSIAVNNGEMSVVECDTMNFVVCEDDLDDFNMNNKANMALENLRQNGKAIEQLAGDSADMRASIDQVNQAANNIKAQLAASTDMQKQMADRDAQIAALTATNRRLTALTVNDPEFKVQMNCTETERVVCQSVCGSTPFDETTTTPFCEKLCICLEVN